MNRLGCLPAGTETGSQSITIYRSVTDGIQITVEPHFLDEQSDPDSNRYFWAYTIEK